MKLKSPAIVLFVLMQVLLCRAQYSSTDTAVVIDLNKKAFAARDNDLELSRQLATQAITIATQLKYKRGLSYSYNILGNYYHENLRYDSSLYYYRESLDIRKILKDTLGIARSYRNIMLVEKSRDSLNKAINIGLIGLELLDLKEKSPEILIEKALLQKQLGFIYSEAGKKQKAIELIYSAKSIFALQKDEIGEAEANMDLATIYESQKRYDRAITEYKACIPIFVRNENYKQLAKLYNGLGNAYYFIDAYKESKSYYLQASSIRRKSGFENEDLGSLINLGIIYEATGKNDSALYYYNQALLLSVKAGNEDIEYDSHKALGGYFYNSEKYRLSLSHFLRANALMRNTSISIETNFLNHEISKTYKALGNIDSAFFYSSKYALLNDSLNDVLLKSIEYATLLKERDAELKYNNQTLNLRGMIIWTMGVAIILLLIIFFLYYRYVKSKRKMQDLREQVKDKELRALDAMLEGQHEERKRLATELHDTIGSMLSATKYSFKAMEKSMEKMVEENKGQYQKINTMLDETMDSVRRISHNMASGIFAEKGLEGALAELCERFEQPGKMQISLNVFGFENIDELDLQMNLYSIVQELLANILKHAQASEVTIQLIKTDKNINLTVEDNGIGFDVKEAKQKRGIGLSNVEKRVERFAGKWNIDSEKGHGTTVVVDIPVNDSKA